MNLSESFSILFNDYLYQETRLHKSGLQNICTNSCELLRFYDTYVVVLNSDFGIRIANLKDLVLRTLDSTI